MKFLKSSSLKILSCAVCAVIVLSLCIAAATQQLAIGITLSVGGRVSLSENSQGLAGGAKWSSSAPTIAQVSSVGLVTARQSGKSIVTLERGGKKANIAVNVVTDGDSVIKNLFSAKGSDVQVSGKGKVSKILADDNEGGKHQRFILQLSNGQTLLVAHNIDIAPRVKDVKVGDAVEFYGEYYYNEQGGGIHWTHHDPAGKHIGGYLKVKSKVYE